jgi:hypothetical protein
MMKPIRTKLAGVSFGNCQENIKLYSYPSFSTYEMTREIGNPYDPNAVRVGVGPYMMGYLPRTVSRVIAPLMDTGTDFIAEHVEVNKCWRYEMVGLTVRIIEVQQ